MPEEKNTSEERGVIYFSSVPKNMRPVEVRSHFNKFGTILRMKFVPFPKKERRKSGSLVPLQYKEGWIEFAKKASAVAAATEFNATPVQCKRTRKCYGQLWTVKFLKGFNYGDLIDMREGERRIRRMEEVHFQSEERNANEAFRRAVLSSHKGALDSRKRKRDEPVTDES